MKRTHTSLVLEALVRGDFATVEILAAQTGSTLNQVHAALWHLQRVGAVDVIEEKVVRWYYATPGHDSRTRVQEVRRIEERPRRRRRQRISRV